MTEYQITWVGQEREIVKEGPSAYDVWSQFLEDNSGWTDGEGDVYAIVSFMLDGKIVDGVSWEVGVDIHGTPFFVEFADYVNS